MFLSHKPATGRGRRVRIVLLICAAAMTIAAVNTIEEGTGGFTTNRHRQIAAAVIMASAIIAVAVAIFAWWQSRRETSHSKPH